MAKICNAELQEKVKAFIHPTTGQMSQAAFAKEIGYSDATVSTYVNDKFNGVVDKFESKLNNFFSFKQKQEEFTERAQPFRPVDNRSYVPTSISENVYSAIEYCRLVGGIAILHGSAGIGKTMAIQKYKRDNQGFVIHFRAGESCKTPKQITAAIAAGLGINGRSGGELYAKVREVIDSSKKVIIVDEAHRLPQRSLEALRDFTEMNDDSGKDGIGIVLVGNTRVMNFISTIKSEEMEQFRNRMVWEGKYLTAHVKLEDIKLIFPLLVEREMEKELSLLWSISKSVWGIRGAVNVYNNAVNRGDISYSGMLKITAESRIGLV